MPSFINFWIQRISNMNSADSGDKYVDRYF